MGRLYYGAEGHAECIAPLHDPPAEVAALGAHPCLGYRFTVSWLVVPYWVSDDGYVLTAAGGKAYTSLDADQLNRLVESGTIATPVPSYAIPTEWRFASLSLWAILLFFGGMAVVDAMRRRRLAEARRSPGLATQPRVVKTSSDRAISTAATARLQAREMITHQAYATDLTTGTSRVWSAHEYWVVLTDRRLLLFTSRIGLVGLFSNERLCRSIDRGDIQGVEAKDEVMTVHISRDNIVLMVPVSVSGFSSSNQLALLSDLPRLFSPPPELNIPSARVVSGG